MADRSSQTTNFEGRCLALGISFVLGLGTYLPWTTMVTTIDSYANLFPQYHTSRILTLIYQSITIGVLSVLVYKEASLNTRLRNLFGYSLFAFCSLAVLVWQLDLSTLGRGSISSFIGLCIISVVFGVANAHVQGGMIGDFSMMAPEFVQSFLAGLAASGALTSGLRLVTKATFKNSREDLRKGAMLLFAISVFFEFVCIILYAYIFPKLAIVKYYRAQAMAQGSKTVLADLAAGGIQGLPTEKAKEAKMILDQRFSNKVLFLMNMDYAINLFLVYLLTTSIFHGFLSKDMGKHNLGDWFLLVLIAVFNFSDLVGRYVPLVKKLKIRSQKVLMIISCGRFLLVPALYFTAKYGNQGWIIFLTSVLGSSNGYLTVCILTTAPEGHLAPEQNALGNILVLCLSGGMFAGVICDLALFIGKGW
ncbi:equilibrative nucleotide transporter 2 isoform X1 [Capsella rubella]|uniref:equilibrative nucleotide transporter 2 isoform X1 n=1 Tax=Capsella rubella TaxID=81985 RepID=UPI000CD5092B|nr:equilibrative nucleotide transporter 2 isoform X1 [Capsella rubella]